jgi:C4-dicarboxylate-specific signal transduction histidine kinase
MLPGGEFLRSTAPLIALLLLTVAALSYLFVRRTFHMAEILRARGESLTRLNDKLEQENQVRKETQVALEEARNALEDRVRERTKELSSSEARLAEAQSLAELGVWEHDIGSSEVRCLNQTSLLFGSAEVTNSIALETLLGRIDENDLGRVKRTGEEAIETGMSELDVTYGLRAHDGETRVLHSQSKIIRDESNQPLRLSGFVQDVTERTSLEENLLQAQKMEALGKLTGGIAHDINNILNVVLGNLDLLAEESNGDTAKRLETAVKATLRGSELANGILAAQTNLIRGRRSQYRDSSNPRHFAKGTSREHRVRSLLRRRAVHCPR